MLQVGNLGGAAGLKGEKGDRVSIINKVDTQICMCVFVCVAGLISVECVMSSCAQTCLALSDVTKDYPYTYLYIHILMKSNMITGCGPFPS